MLSFLSSWSISKLILGVAFGFGATTLCSYCSFIPFAVSFGMSAFSVATVTVHFAASGFAVTASVADIGFDVGPLSSSSSSRLVVVLSDKVLLNNTFKNGKKMLQYDSGVDNSF